VTHELRLHPLLGGWIIVCGKREKRPWRSGECPFCPGREETRGSWKVLALPNKFPALSPKAPAVLEEPFFKRSRAIGECEVIIETPRHEGDFSDLPIEQVALYIELLAERTRVLGSKPYIETVVPFKNKGALIGVSLTHPHSQIYAFPFIPPRIMKEIRSVQEFRKKHGENLFEKILKAELEDGSRIIYANKSFVLFMPFFTMWPYEMHIYPLKNPNSLTDLDREDAKLLGDAIRVAVSIYESLFGKDCAYMMIFHQAPVKGSYPDYRLHVEFYPPHFTANRIKYAAGIEWGAWVFTYDGIPEERASELRKAAKEVLSEVDHLGEVYG